MGILNITPDSFSDPGRFVDLDKAVSHGLDMARHGADLLDIGGESSRPGAEPVSAEVEMARVIPVIDRLRKAGAPPISIDTYKATTAEAALAAGAEIINDISALRFDDQMGPLVARTRVPVILMHMLGTPRDMQKNPKYDDCVEEIASFFEERIRFATICGIKRSQIVLDPGIGFGKRLEDNLSILRGLKRLTKFGLPILVGASRKSFIGALTGAVEPSARLGGSIAVALSAVGSGAQIFRVHDVPETVQALKMHEAMKNDGYYRV